MWHSIQQTNWSVSNEWTFCSIHFTSFGDEPRPSVSKRMWLISEAQVWKRNAKNGRIVIITKPMSLHPRVFFYIWVSSHLHVCFIWGRYPYCETCLLALFDIMKQCIYPWLVSLLSAHNDTRLVIWVHTQQGGRNSRMPHKKRVAVKMFW